MATNEVNILIKAKDMASAKIGGIAGKMGGALRLGAIAGAAAVAGLGFAAVKMAADFETGFAEVTTLFEGSKQQVDRLRQGVIDMAAEMGVNAVDATEALYNAISAGVDPDNAVAFLRENTRFAIAGVTDLNTAVDLTTTVMNAWGMEAEALSHVQDVLFMGVKAGKTTVDELGASMFQVAPIAAAVGVSLEDVTAGLAILTAQGVPTAQAATQMKAAIAELAKEGTKADKAFRDLAGVGFAEFVTEQEGMDAAFQLLAKGADDAGISLIDMFGSIEAGQAALGLTAGAMNEFGTLSGNMRLESGAVGEAFEKMNETFGRQFGILKNQLSIILMEVGLRILPMLTSAIQGVLGPLREFADVTGNLLTLAIQVLTKDLVGYGETFKELPASIQPFATKLISVMRIIRDDVIPAVRALAENFIVGMRTILEAVRPMFQFIFDNKPIMIAALIAIGVAIVLAFGPVSVAMVAILGLIIAIGWVRDNWEMLKEETMQILSSIGDFIDTAMGDWDEIIVGAVTAIVGFIRDNWEAISGIILFQLNLIKINIEDALTFIRDLFRFASAVFQGEWGEAWDILKGIVTDRLDFMKERIELVMNLIRDVFDLGWAVVKDLFVAALEGLYNVVVFIGTAIVNWFAGLPQMIIDALGDLGSFLFNAGKDMIQGFIDGILSLPIPNPLDLVPGGGLIGAGLGLLGFHQGGIVPGLPGQAVPILAEAGERLTSARDVEAGIGGGGGTTINVYVEDRSPAAIANAVQMASLELGNRIAMAGV